MQFQSPLRTVTPTVDGDVLEVLARADSAFTISTLRTLMPPRSVQGTRNALERLAEQGIVLVDEVARTRSYRLNREHLAADAIIAIATTKHRFVERLRRELDAFGSQLVFAALYGSAARGEMRADSDIDILLVRTPAAEADEFMIGAHELERRVRAWTGNLASILIAAEDDVTAAEPLFSAVRDEGIHLAGDADWLRNRLRDRVAS